MQFTIFSVGSCFLGAPFCLAKIFWAIAKKGLVLIFLRTCPSQRTGRMNLLYSEMSDSQSTCFPHCLHSNFLKISRELTLPVLITVPNTMICLPSIRLLISRIDSATISPEIGGTLINLMSSLFLTDPWLSF